MWQQQGITSYVCGSHAQRLCYSEELLKQAFSCQSPKIVLLETNALYCKISFQFSLRHRLEEWLPVFRYHNRWKSLTLRDFDFTVNYNHMEVNKGYWYRTNVKSASTSKYMKPSDKAEHVNAKNRALCEAYRPAPAQSTMLNSSCSAHPAPRTGTPSATTAFPNWRKSWVWSMWI